MRWLLPAFAGLAVGACSKPGDHFPAAAWAGGPWTGQVRVVTELPGRDTPLHDLGTGSARFAVTGAGTGELVVAGVIGKDRYDTGFSVDGRYDADGWIARYEDLTVRIDRDGRISGGGRLQEQAYHLAGSLSPTHLDLTVEIRVRTGPAGQSPPVSMVRLTYALSHARSDDDSGADSDADAGNAIPGLACDQIRVTPKTVPSLSGGATSTILVPVCDD